MKIQMIIQGLYGYNGPTEKGIFCATSSVETIISFDCDNEIYDYRYNFQSALSTFLENNQFVQETVSKCEIHSVKPNWLFLSVIKEMVK